MCSPTLLDLAPTKTHRTRRAVWSPLAGQLHDGTLTLVQGKREADSYKVQLVRAEDGGAVALLLKDDGEVYEARRAERGWVCSCRVFGFTGHCKHADGLAAVEADALAGG